MADPIPESALPRLMPRRWIVIAAVVAVAAIALGLVASERWSLVSAEATARHAAQSRALTSQNLVSTQLQKYRMLPLVLADYPDVQNALDSRSPEAIAKLDARLKLIRSRTDAAQIYVIAPDGLTIASSNWQLPNSFVGQNYGFRPYFAGAMAHGAAEQFALGTVSRRAGLFLARRVAGNRGVVVVKVEFDPIEAAWTHQSGPTVLRDENGVVIMTSHPSWRLRATRALPPATSDAIQRARLYGDNGPRPLAPDLTLASDDHELSREHDGRRFVTATLPIPVTGWSVTALEPLDPALQAASAEFRIVALLVALVMLVVTGLWARASEARQLRAAAQLELERQVELRTAELRSANDMLVHESRERERNEARLRIAREELAQSNRLATLGQITAGVAHEINQPLAALRAFAENAHLLIDRGRAADAATNLGQIVSLSERIGNITGELRLFARREGGKGPVPLGTAIDGALLLIGDRLRQLDVRVERRGDDDSTTMVAADRVRIEQILINLLQNATDAIAGVPQPRIMIITTISDTTASITIVDNGPGMSRKVERDLFKSFVTQKADGLGLGLVISRDLAREVGGELTYEPGGAGATFLLRLPLA